MNSLAKFTVLAAIAFAAASCSASKRSARSLPSVTDNSLMRNIGYLPSWSYDRFEELDWSALTHINIAFCNPDTLGNMQNPFRTRPEDFRRIIETAHRNGIRVMASLGGGGGGRNYPALIATEESRRDFCVKIMDYVKEWGLDGVDLDLEEGPGHRLWNDYEAWVVELRRHCTAEGIVLTTAVSTWFSDSISDKTFECFDFINIMAYDGPFEAHSTMELAETMARHYNEKRGVEAKNIVIGVPFYGYPSDGGFGDSRTYRDLLAEYPKAWRKDRIDKFGHNGSVTMRAKCRLARHYGGIMIWQLSGDGDGNRSLLGVIKKNLFDEGAAHRPVIN